ncbi:MAG: hypothetical protein M1339_03360, partial [Bacteroidetes bacterium]|nr:hypothetical protein [Bacteroidota bacterium]
FAETHLRFSAAMRLFIIRDQSHRSYLRSNSEGLLFFTFGFYLTLFFEGFEFKIPPTVTPEILDTT